MPATETADRLKLIVYGRGYCHLCEDMIVALRQMQGRFEFDLSIIDVDSDAALEAQFGEKVPVLMCRDRELCHYFLDEPVVTAFLSEIR